MRLTCQPRRLFFCLKFVRPNMAMKADFPVSPSRLCLLAPLGPTAPPNFPREVGGKAAQGFSEGPSLVALEVLA